MADAIVSVVLEQLATVVGQEVKLVVGVDKEVKKLTSNFQIIQAVLADAEQRQVREEAVRVWLENLKDVSYDMDDVLDEWNTAILRRLHIKGAENVHTLKSKVRSGFLFPRDVLRRFVLRRRIAFKLKAIHETIAEMYKFNFTTSMEQPQRVESTSFIDVSEVFGRDEQMNGLVSKLLHKSSEEQNRIPIISIVGMGGIGKTTLAQLVYNNDEVIKEFEKIIWVCVSDPFNVLNIARAILENLEDHASDLSTLQSLLKKISESLKDKKFLIVLDDVWTEDYSDWEPFHHCLKNGLTGSKVLITTRKQTTALMMKSIDMISIEGLSEEQCWSLFKQSAFFGRSIEECENLEEIGRKIVSKCKGLPLAVKAMGSLLRFKRTIEEWENVLYSEMWKLEGLENEVLAPLLLSYYDLPSMVKQCFTYCAVFPKDFDFEKDYLIKLWMAQGYLGLNQNEDIEVIGENYFNILAMRSFFQEFEKDDDGRIVRCKMHDIVHDVAQFLSKDECCKVGVDGLIEGNNEKARHCWLSEMSSTHSISICNFKKLRSLFIDDIINDGNKSIDEVLGNLFDELTCLKSFKIRNSRRDIEIIPKEFGKLIHLRYLDLSENEDLIKLPETLCELYNLQTLNLGYCDGLEELPQGIGKLINLRYLMNEGCDSLTSMPKGFERLTRLRTISEFPLGGGDYGGQACSLDDLHHLKRLRLIFRSSDSKKDEAILEAFQPPPNLQWLRIENYRGRTMSTIWMESLTNLRFLNLNGCDNCLHLPPLGKLPSLETLIIEGMRSVRAVGKEFLGIESDESSSSSSFISFPKLKTLQFWRMRDWEVWDFGVEDHTTIMPSLRSLEISYCYKLKGLPKQLLQTALLENLSIQDFIQATL